MEKMFNVSPSPQKKKSSAQLIYGLRPVLEALSSGTQLDKVFMQKGLVGQIVPQLRAAIEAAHVPVQYVPVEKLNSLVHGNHQGVVASIATIAYQHFETLAQHLLDDDDHVPLLVLLDHVTDVRNMGAIARTAECAGADALIVPAHGSALINDDAVKTSSGALLRLPVCREDNLKTTINLARQLGYQVVAATEKASVSYLKVDFSLPTVILLGAEDRGIDPQLLRLADRHAQIPIRGQVQSLNVSVAAAIFLYEAVRQRGSE